MPRKYLSVAVLLAIAVLAFAQRAVDYRYAPPTHLTALCFPADWQKTLITERGSLAYDFGPGPYARPLTEVAIGVKGSDLHLRTLAIRNPRIPIAEAEYAAGGAILHTTSFALLPEAEPRHAGSFSANRVRRIGGLNGVVAWARPEVPADPAFRGVAWGTNRPILYRVAVPRGSRHLVALGICEPYKSVTGQRVMELQVEGAATLTVDAFKEKRKNVPYVYFFDGRDADQDGEIAIEVHGSQQGLDPNVILNAFWVFPEGTKLSAEEVIRGEATPRAEIAWSCGEENPLSATSPRIDGILARFEGESLTPTIVLRTPRDVSFNRETGVVSSQGRPFLFARPAMRAAERQGDVWTLELAAGVREAELFVISGPCDASLLTREALAPDLQAALEKVRTYWEAEETLPFGRMSVPDPQIQYLLDASIRTLYQISEWVDGSFQFQPGPSVYRGLWLHDEAWDVSAALMLGDTTSARRAVETMLRFQQADGRVYLSEPFPMQRETPLTLHAMSRYALFSADTSWLGAHWSALSNAVTWIRAARASTLADPTSVFFGLFPPGFADGGLGGLEAEYGTTYWSLSALRLAARAAESVGRADSARSWNALADEILRSFARAARRDKRRDAYGNLYLPMKVGDTSSTMLPQQANWGMLDGQGIGHVFPYDDPLVNGTLSMLDSSARQGLPYNAGWLKGGVWPFLGGLEGITHVYQRHYERAQEILYAYANHASSLGTWLEEQHAQGEGTRTGGDACDATAGTLFIKLVRRLIAIERSDTLDLLAGVPQGWYTPGAEIQMKGTLTALGPLSLRLKISPDGTSARLAVGRLSRGGRLKIALGGLKEAGYSFADGRALPSFFESAASAGAELTLVRSQP